MSVCMHARVRLRVCVYVQLAGDKTLPYIAAALIAQHAHAHE